MVQVGVELRRRWERCRSRQRPGSVGSHVRVHVLPRAVGTRAEVASRGQLPTHFLWGALSGAACQLRSEQRHCQYAMQLAAQLPRHREHQLRPADRHAADRRSSRRGTPSRSSGPPRGPAANLAALLATEAHQQAERGTDVKVVCGLHAPRERPSAAHAVTASRLPSPSDEPTTSADAPDCSQDPRGARQ